jgi:prophage antirepressor-like protein
MNGMQVFSNLEFGSICTIKVDGEPWFVLKDVRKVKEVRRVKN